jgi:hypothetical protein
MGRCLCLTPRRAVRDAYQKRTPSPKHPTRAVLVIFLIMRSKSRVRMARCLGLTQRRAMQGVDQRWAQGAEAVVAEVSN